jgi:cobalt-zinc-cadmium efflux system protein
VGAGHLHDHPHSHDHSSRRYGRAFAIGIALNVAVVLLEVFGGIASRSMALLSDAAHNASDVVGLGLAWGATVLSRRRPSARRTYGLRRATILAALGNAVLLLVAIGGVGAEAIRRLFAPAAVHAPTLVAVATIAAVVNAVSALLFARDRKHDLNVGSAFAHLAWDAVLALGVVGAGLVVAATGWYLLDPVVALVLAVLVLVAAWSVLRRSLDLALDAVPEGIDPDGVRAYLLSVPGVLQVHDLHIWAMSTTEAVLTAHLVMPQSAAADPRLLLDVEHALHERFHIDHATLQIEPEEAPSQCRLTTHA